MMGGSTACDAGGLVLVMRLVDLLGGLSRTADLGFGLPAGEALRSAALGMLLGRSLGLADDELRAALYSSLLLHLGCIGHSHEAAALFGNEVAANAAIARTNVADPKSIVTTFLPALLRGHAPLTQLRLGARALAKGKRFGLAYETTACEIGRSTAQRLRLPASVERSIYHSYERWDGSGVPAALEGEDIPVGARVAVLCSVASLFDTIGGVDLATDAVRRQSGSILDPGITEQFSRHADALLAEVDGGDPHELVLDAEPEPVARVAESQLPVAAAAFGDVADLKTPYTHGHSRGVAALARRAGESLGLSPADVDDLEVAALLHDLGRVAVPNTIWEKPGELSSPEWEQVRLHPYHSERILAGSDRLAPLARLVGRHHERLDGTGYHRGCGASDLGMPERVLAVADAYQAMREPRPHRPALDAAQIERELLHDVEQGRLDADAVTSVLRVAGHDAVATREAPAGLTDREIEVLNLVAEGCTNAGIAERLAISRRTAEHHVQHIYTKIGVSSRAAAALFAVEHQLLRPR
jgi:HD-GYP domain-containing protein (c-di-GMP phosphodiesterase class II)